LILGGNEHSPCIHELDTSDLNKWKENVFERARSIYEHYERDLEKGLEPNKIQKALLNLNNKKDDQEAIHEYNECYICNRVFVNKFQWQCHLKGTPHKKRQESLRRKELRVLADQIKLLEDQSHSKLSEESLKDKNLN
jgi:hypothetical protein